MRIQTAPAAAGVTLTRKAERYLSENEPRQTTLTKRAAASIAVFRRGVETEIERLISLLDRIDGDPDLETAEDPDLEDSDHSGCGDGDGFREVMSGEPSLGATVDINQVFAWRRLCEARWFVDDGEPELSTAEMEDRYGVAPATGGLFGDGEEAKPARRPSWQVPMIGPRVPERSGQARAIGRKMLSDAGLSS